MTITRVESTPPGRDKNRLALEHIASAILIISIEHGPIHDFLILLAFYLRRIGGFDLLPGTPGDISIIREGFAPAEAAHFLGDCAHESNNHITKLFLPGRAGFLKGMEKINFIRVETFW